MHNNQTTGFQDIQIAVDRSLLAFELPSQSSRVPASMPLEQAQNSQNLADSLCLIYSPFGIGIPTRSLGEFLANPKPL